MIKKNENLNFHVEFSASPEQVARIRSALVRHVEKRNATDKKHKAAKTKNACTCCYCRQ